MWNPMMAHSIEKLTSKTNGDYSYSSFAVQIKLTGFINKLVPHTNLREAKITITGKTNQEEMDVYFDPKNILNHVIYNENCLLFFDGPDSNTVFCFTENSKSIIKLPWNSKEINFKFLQNEYLYFMCSEGLIKVNIISQEIFFIYAFGGYTIRHLENVFPRLNHFISEELPFFVFIDGHSIPIDLFLRAYEGKLCPGGKRAFANGMVSNCLADIPVDEAEKLSRGESDVRFSSDLTGRYLFISFFPYFFILDLVAWLMSGGGAIFKFVQRVRVVPDFKIKDFSVVPVLGGFAIGFYGESDKTQSIVFLQPGNSNLAGEFILNPKIHPCLMLTKDIAILEPSNHQTVLVSKSVKSVLSINAFPIEPPQILEYDLEWDTEKFYLTLKRPSGGRAAIDGFEPDEILACLLHDLPIGEKSSLMADFKGGRKPIKRSFSIVLPPKYGHTSQMGSDLEELKAYK